MKCSYCGAETNSSQCEYCNAPTGQPKTSIPRKPYKKISRKSKSTAITLCCLGFFGLSGLHRFYAGKISTGIIWLLTDGCFGIGTIMDLVSIITNKFYDDKGRCISR
ncbi:MAG: TM2 domain-containing protein [Ruminococcus flavefaciens]|nr:TM2 domain-containing protein [Ruminococcus flavefaciens]